MPDRTQQKALRVLMVEDSADDAELIVDNLTEDGSWSTACGSSLFEYCRILTG